MTHKFKYLAVLAGLALAQATPAQQVTMPLSSLTGASLTGKILCRDGSKVPMTADPEQSLPLNIVALLNCGQEVALLSGNDSYTVNVHTIDGKTGYVAWMNVAMHDALKKIILQSAPVQDGVAKWTPGTPGSDKFYNDDVLVESLTVHAVTVQVSLQDTGWKLIAHVAIANGGTDSVNVVPSGLALTNVAQTNKSLAYQNPQKMKSAMSHQILWTRANAVPSENAYLKAQPSDYSASATHPQNYLGQHQVSVQLAKDDFNPHAETESLSLRAAALLPDQQIAGASWFGRDGKCQDMVLHVPVGDTVYEFPFSVNHK